jgi:mono/diheme cytochrome c family protein
MNSERDQKERDANGRVCFHEYKLADLIRIIKRVFVPNPFIYDNFSYRKSMLRNMKLVPFLFGVLLLTFAISCGSERSSVNNANVSSSPKTPPVPAATVDELASGKKVYETNCILCHKADGTGGRVSIEGKNLNVEDLTSAKIKGFTDEKIIGYVMNGVEDEGMPAFKGRLSEGEMRDVVRYIRTLQGK